MSGETGVGDRVLKRLFELHHVLDSTTTFMEDKIHELPGMNPDENVTEVAKWDLERMENIVKTMPPKMEKLMAKIIAEIQREKARKDLEKLR